MMMNHDALTTNAAIIALPLPEGNAVRFIPAVAINSVDVDWRTGANGKPFVRQVQIYTSRQHTFWSFIDNHGGHPLLADVVAQLQLAALLPDPLEAPANLPPSV